MADRGITLIEMLIAIAILLAIGAIAVPLTLRAMDERRFNAAAEQVEVQLLLARTYAQRTGDPVELRYHPDSGRIIARKFLWSGSEIQQTSISGAQADREFDSSLLEDDGAGSIVEAWADRRLSQGVELRDQPPQRAMSTAELMQSSRVNGEMPAEREVIRLAVFLPDGSAILSRTIWLTDRHDRIGRVRISEWTGTPHYERLPDLIDDAQLPEDDNADQVMTRERLNFE